MKNIKYKITKFNDYIIKLFNSVLNFFKFKNNKISKISNFNKYLIFLISTLFIYLFYLSIPTLYNKNILQKQLAEKLTSEYNLNVSLSSEIDYLILPSPHILIKNAKIFNYDKKNPKEISQIKKL